MLDICYQNVRGLNTKSLIHKLIKTVFCDPLLIWLNSFLTIGIVMVKLKNFVLEPIHVLSGVL